jgi:TPR repeat protein
MKRSKIISAAGTALAAALTLTHAAHAESQFAPGSTNEASARLRLKCHFSVTCPLSSQDYALFNRAIEGDHDAEYRMGDKLEHGVGMTADMVGATQWYARAAEGGSVRAARALNRLYASGVPIHADNVQIAAALQSQARNGNAEAERVLSQMYDSGRGLRQEMR